MMSLQIAYLAGGRKLNGAHLRTARSALSDATSNTGSVLWFVTTGSAARDPSRLSSIRTETTKLRAFCTPTGTSQQSRSRACSAANSSADSVIDEPVEVPSVAV